MPRKSHDLFAKEWMKELLADFGEVKIERPVSSEVRTIDLLFYPNPDRLADLEALGLLGRILSKPCPIEFFRNAVPTQEIKNCREKNADLHGELRRIAEQKGEKLRDPDLPTLWIITPTLSLNLQKTFCMVTKPKWRPGIYFLPENDFTGIIVVHQLPVNLDTLWIRLLGRNSVQRAAIEELISLEEDYPYQRETLRHLSMLQVNLKMRQNNSKDLREVMMNLAPAYEQWYKKTIAEGKQIGITEGKQIGITEGKQAQSIQTARRMLSKNMPLEEIAELTDLPLTQIQSLQAENR
jgi:hypothetical protein